MKVLVTGGAGFIGSHLVDALLLRKHRVFVVDNLVTGTKKNLNPRVHGFFRENVQSAHLGRIFAKVRPQAVFHCAAQMDVRRSLTDPLYDEENNIRGTLNLIDNAARYCADRMYFASSGGAIYGEAKVRPTPETYRTEPLSPYGISKNTGEFYLRFYYQQRRLAQYVALRLANVYGPRQNHQGEAGVVALFCTRLLKGMPCFINGSGAQTRDFIFVHDVVDAFMHSLEKDKSGIYNVGTGKETSIRDLYWLTARLIGASSRKPRRRPAITGEVMHSALDSRSIRRALKWKTATSLTHGLVKTIEYFRSIGP